MQPKVKIPISTIRMVFIRCFSFHNAASNSRLVIVGFVQQWQSHAQKAQAQAERFHLQPSTYLSRALGAPIFWMRQRIQKLEQLITV